MSVVIEALLHKVLAFNSGTPRLLFRVGHNCPPFSHFAHPFPFIFPFLPTFPLPFSSLGPYLLNPVRGYEPLQLPNSSSAF